MFTGKTVKNRDCHFCSYATYYVGTCSVLPILRVPEVPVSLTRSPSSFLLSCPRHLVLGDTNDTAGGTCACISRHLGIRIVALAEVIGAGVDDNCTLSFAKSVVSKWLAPDLEALRRREARAKGGGMRRTPSTLFSPNNLIWLSFTSPLLLPWPSVSKLPRSPTWRSVSLGAPCCLPNGLTIQERERVGVSKSLSLTPSSPSHDHHGPRFMNHQATARYDIT